MCDKKSCEACTEKMDKFNSVNALPLEAAFFMFSDYSNTMAMLNFFFIKHSKTECTVRSFGLTSTCYFETSSVQGVHHAGVAVELEHMLKNNKLVMILLTRLLFNFTTYYFNLAECIRILLVILNLGKSLHHAGVTVKVNHFKVKCLDKIILSLSSYQDLAECNWNNLRLVAGSMMRTSLAKVMHHSVVAAIVDSWLLERQMKKMIQESMKLYKKMQNPNFFLLWECYRYMRMSTWFGFCLAGSFYWIMWELAESLLAFIVSVWAAYTCQSCTNYHG